MSFYTSLTGLNAATSQLAVTSNNIANVGTTGFKRSRADFGDIFATSPLQKASSVIGQGVALKQVSQEFSQGNIAFSANSLDIAITGDGFFPLKSADGLQDIFTRNGTFLLNESYNVVNSAGQALIAAAVDSSGKADLDNLSKLLIPRKTSGDAQATSEIQLGLNFPSDAQIPALPFDRNDPSTYNKTTAITVYDAGGNDYLATVYYRKTQVATPTDATNKWQTYVYIGDTKLQELLIQSSDKNGEKQYVNKYGEIRSESDIPPQDIARGVTKLFNLDDLKNPAASSAAIASGGALLPSQTNEWKNAITFPEKIDTLLGDGAASVLSYSMGGGAQTYSFDDGTFTYTGSDLESLVDSITADDALHKYTVELNPTGDTLIVRANVDQSIMPPIVKALPKIEAEVTDVPMGASDAPAVVTTDGAADVTESNLITFQTLNANDTVTIAGLTFTATGTVAAADVAAAFAAVSAGNNSTQANTAITGLSLAGSFTSGTLDGWDPGPVSGAAVPFTSTTANTDVTDIVTSVSAGATALSIVPTSGSAAAIETAQITFKELRGGNSIKISGLTYTASEVTSAEDLAAAFAAVFASTATITTAEEANLALTGTTSGPFSGTKVAGWTAGAASGAVVTFTSATADQNITPDIVTEFIRPQIDLTATDKTAKFSPIPGATSYVFDDGKFTYTGTTLKELASNITLANSAHLKYTVSYSAADEQLVVTPAAGISSLDAPYLTASFDAQADIKFNLSVDGSSELMPPIDLSYLHKLKPEKKFTGVEIAREMTNVINKAFGDDKYFDFTSLAKADTPDTANLFKISINNTKEATISLSKNTDVPNLATMTIEEAVAAIQKNVNAAFTDPADPQITVGYNPVKQSFTFKATDEAEISLMAADTVPNQLFGLPTAKVAVDPTTGTYGATVLPNGGYIVDPADQRFGITVTFDEANNRFNIASGTTGDTSSIKISNATALASALFGFPVGTEGTETATSSTPLRGIASQPAVLSGNTIGINLDNKFRVDGSNNQFVVTVDNVTGLIEMPQRADYNIEEFRQELERRINSLADSFGRTVSGVTVEVATTPGTNNKFFKFTTGTTGDNSFMKVSANSIWGLANVDSVRGSTSRWLEPKQAMNENGFPLYVDRDGLETSDPGSFSEDETRELWSPIFLDKGELTFDTGGNLKSPVTATEFKSTTIGNSGATLQFSIDYGSSTQFSAPFSVQKQNQNGRPEGDLIGVDIADDGLVSASYSNGNQKSLAKIVLVNFAAPTGLRQIGDSSYYSTSKSGDAKYGEAGAAGFGTVRAGARERANVDLTTELVELITAQRNFQANAKAIETNNTLTQAIINIRS